MDICLIYSMYARFLLSHSSFTCKKGFYFLCWMLYMFYILCHSLAFFLVCFSTCLKFNLTSTPFFAVSFFLEFFYRHMQRIPFTELASSEEVLKKREQESCSYLKSERDYWNFSGALWTSKRAEKQKHFVGFLCDIYPLIWQRMWDNLLTNEEKTGDNLFYWWILRIPWTKKF